MDRLDRILSSRVPNMDRPICRRTFFKLGVVAAAAFAAGPGRAQGAPVRIVVPFAPGGGNDIFARLLAPGISQALKSPAIVDNRAGASGNIGASYVAHAAPDGKTVLYASSSIVINPAVMGNIPFDVRRDLVPVSLAVSQPLTMVVRRDLGISSLSELLARMRSQKINLAYGNASLGSISNLTPEILFRRANVSALSVPYKGAGQLMTALLGGEVQAAFMIYPVAKPYLEKGDLVALATTGQGRLKQLPRIPTLVEEGFADLVADQWHGVFMPAGTPEALAVEFQMALSSALEEAAVRRRMDDEGAAVIGSAPKAFAEYLDKELARWRQIARETGIRISA